MFDPQICQKFQNQKLNCCKFCTSSIFFSPQSLTQKFQHQMVYIWPKFSLQFCSKFLEQNSDVECFALLSLFTKINKNFSKWCLQNLTQEKALGETSNLSTLRTTGSDIFSKYWPVSDAKIGLPIGTNFCAKLDTKNLHQIHEFLVQYFGDKFGTRLFQTVSNFQLNFEPFRRSFLTQKFSATWLQISKQFFKLFRNLKTGL